jgi:hypothetical protein
MEYQNYDYQEGRQRVLLPLQTTEIFYFPLLGFLCLFMIYICTLDQTDTIRNVFRLEKYAMRAQDQVVSRALGLIYAFT